jgi:hypothetical protein
MTPLAHRLARNIVLPIRQRDPYWANYVSDLGDAFEDTHFFDTTAIFELVPQLAKVPEAVLLKHLFLPAPKTWIEWGPNDNGILGRAAVLLEQESSDKISVKAMMHDYGGPIGVINPSTGSFNISVITGVEPAVPHGMAHLTPVRFRTITIITAVIMLLAINSPKIIGRRQHMPHAGLEKKLRKAGAIGRYPLHAWHEILLEARPTYVDESGETQEAHLTGQKCLHFCRAHLRVRLGRLELVSAHWRGDPALGIKRARYKVTA